MSGQPDKSVWSPKTYQINRSKCWSLKTCQVNRTSLLSLKDVTIQSGKSVWSLKMYQVYQTSLFGFLRAARSTGRLVHYKNKPIQIYWKFYHQTKKKNSGSKILIFFYISAQNIDCGYSLEPPRRGGSNEYPKFMFWAEIRKIMYHCKPRLYYIKVGFKEVKII